MKPIMRFKKGSQVEVWRTNEVPTGSWHNAEIICGNGHIYTVQVYGYGGTSGETSVERVHHNLIRPCPPAMCMLEMWAPGDVLEVFENFSWKMATVLKVLGEDYLLVRILGSSKEFSVHSSESRPRQSWKDGEWIVIGQVSAVTDDGRYEQCQNLKHNRNAGESTQVASIKMKQSYEGGCIPIKKRPIFVESHIISSNTRKRGSPDCCSRVGSFAEASLKHRAVDREGRGWPVSANRSSPTEKVDFVAFRQETCGNILGAHSKRKAAGFSFFDPCQMKSSEDVCRPHPSGSESNDIDHVTCSVGSCTVASESSSNFSANPFEDVSSRVNYEEHISWQSTEQVLQAEIHRLELDAYRCTLEAFHASGPLSWEQEALISNLRLSLHISDDEHLTELRNLVFSNDVIPITRQ